MTPTITTGDDDQARLIAALERRAQRAIASRQEAEALLERRSRELDRSNRDLRLRHDELQAKLELGNRQLLGAQRTARIATIHRDRGGNYLVSPELATLLGRTAGEEITPQILLEHIHPLDRAAIAASAIAFFANAAPEVDHRYEHRIVRVDGTLRWFRWLLRCTVDAAGRHAAVSGTVQDITEQRVAERRARALQLVRDRELRKLREVEQRLADRVRELEALSADLRRSRRDAEQAYRARTQFISLMSHDIRTPMNGLLGMMTALADTTLDPTQHRQLTLARRAGEQLRVLLDDIIGVAGGESDIVALDPVACALRPTIARVTDFWLASVRGGEVTIATTIDPTLPAFALLDQTRFRQLLDNAVGAAVRRSVSGHVELAASQQGSRLVIEVVDDGPPLSAQAQGLFAADTEQLARLAAGNMLPSHLGILLCRRIVARMGGTIGTATTNDRRNRFWLDVPLVAVAAPAVPDEAPGQARRILVAEDIETNQIVICSMLDAIGYRHHVVADGEQAVAAVRDGDFDAVLMDVQMPVMDGTEATRRIRALAGVAGRVPIIGVTAHVQPVEREALLAAGMNACLAKPIGRDELARTLADALAATAAGDDPIDAERFALAFAAIPQARCMPLFDLFAADLVRLTADAVAARMAGDAVGLARAAHSMRSVSGNFGARAVSAAIADLQACRDADRAAAVARLNAATAATIARGRAIVATPQRVQ